MRNFAWILHPVMVEAYRFLTSKDGNDREMTGIYAEPLALPLDERKWQKAAVSIARKFSGEVRKTWNWK